MKNNLPEEKTMKWYFRLILIVLFLIGFTWLLPFFFSILDKLPDSYALGIIAVLIIVFVYCFIPYKIWKLKK
jgi:membrane protein YdbS with pleckstrin-like domain